MNDHAYTSSEFGSFRNCRREWWLHTYRRLKLKEQFKRPSTARIGNLVHDCMEVLYDEASDIPWPQVLDTERDRLAALLADGDVTQEWHDRMLEQVAFARIIMQGYEEWMEDEGADQGLQFMSTEERVDVVINGVRFLGKLDAVVWDEEAEMLLFMDHKTTTSFEQLWSGLLIKEQFIHYEMLNREAYDEKTGGVIINGIRRVKRSSTSEPPYYERNRRYFGEIQVNTYRKRAMAIVADIENVRARLDAGEDHQTACYPRPNSDCHWRCEFFKVCHMFDDGSRIEDFLEEYYEVGDPLERYADKGDETDE